MSEKRDVIVVGAGPAGYAAAFMAADKGREVTIVDPEKNPGGVCLYRGCIPTKALLHVVKTRYEARRAAEWGLRFGDPELDLDRLREWKGEVVAKLTGGVGSLAKRRKIEHIHGIARLSDASTLEVTDGDEQQTLSAENVILATGSRARMLPMMPDDERVWIADHALDIPFVPKRLLVVGGGYIGLEMSYIYNGLGASVDMVEMTDGLMPGADRDIVEVFTEANETLFERTLLSTMVESVNATSDGLDVSFSGEGAPEESARYDAILVATGRTPNLERVGVEAVGIELTDEGFVAVDDQMRTNIDHIFAVGDIVGPPLLAHKGLHEGRIAGAVLGGENQVINDARAIPSVEYTDPEVAWVGLTETQAKQQGRSVKVSRFPWKASGRAITMGRSSGLTKLIIDPDSERILGACIAGAHAGEMIAEAAHAVEMASTARDLELTIHPHPTLTETLLGAAQRFYGTATDI